MFRLLDTANQEEGTVKFSTRLQSALAQCFSAAQYRVSGCATYGGHGEQTAVFQGSIAIAGPEWIWLGGI